MVFEEQNVTLLAMWAVSFLLVVAGILIVLSSINTLRYWWAMRRLDPVGAVAVEPGLREVTGRAQSVEETVTAPFSERDTLVCEWEILSYSPGGGDQRTEESGSLTAPFEIEHEGSTVAVDSSDATKHLTTEFTFERDDNAPPAAIESFLEDNSTSVGIESMEVSSKNYHFIEKRLDPDEEVYVLGPVERDSAGVAESTARHTISVNQGGWLSAVFATPFIISDSGEKTAQRRQLKQGVGLLGSGILLSLMGAGMAVFVSLI